MCFVFQSEIKEAGGQIKAERSRATVLDVLFAQAGEDGEQDKKKKRKEKENEGYQMCSHFLQFISPDLDDPLPWQQHGAYVLSKKKKAPRSRSVIAGET